MEPRILRLPERHVAVAEHRGPPETVDRTRRPLYQHMVLHELVGGPSILRWLERPSADRVVDALVATHAGFDGDGVCSVEVLPAGEYAVLDYQGPPSGVDAARRLLLDWVRTHGRRLAGPVLQVHLMDPVEGALEAELQAPLRPPTS